ncbi:LuxR family transcriptional regulator [Microlunatus sp. Gsoil 973]|uniref:helix-turn-helix transcriptional regulator n=1 Tax=Microlunatus sp. Gsoil 973 TaxID=2672569 RepID=UPI0018A7EF4E|nr:LuxR family transcriptional regulator [Microlunatus sp. Gsoil 973]
MTGGTVGSTDRARRILGRTDALDQIDRFIDEVAAGPVTLTISGEHGMGRTSLWRYAVAAARDRGLRVVATRSAEEDRAVAGTAMRDLFGGGPDPATENLSATPGFDVGRRALDNLRRLAADGPVLVAVDDAQWLDALSANGLRFAIQRLTEQPVGVLSTMATALPGPEMPLGLRYGHHVHLGPLAADMLRKILASTVPTVSRPELVRAHQLSGGNPGLALDLFRSGHSGREQPSEYHRLLSDLAPDTLTVLRVLALSTPSAADPAAQRVVAGVVAQASGVDDFAGAVREAEAAGLIAVSEELTLGFVDQHAARAALAGMNPLDRCTVHARLSDLDPDPADAARHRALATVLPEESVAFEMEAAAAQCADRGRSDLAADLAGHAVRLTPPGHNDAAGRRARAEVDYRAAAGEIARAIDLADRLLARLPPGPGRAQVLAKRVFLDFGESQNFLHQALLDVGEDQALRARILDLIGWQYGLYQGRLADGVRYSRQALDLGRRLDDAEVVAQAGATLAATLSLGGHPREDLFTESIRRADTVRLSPLGRWPSVFWARHLLWSGRLDEARRIFLRAESDAIKRGSEFQRPYRLHDLAVAEVCAGELRTARAEAEAGIQAARDAGNEQAVSWLAHPLGLAAALQRDTSTAQWCSELLAGWGAANDQPPRQAMADEVRGDLAATAGDWDTAFACFHRMLEQLDAMGYQHPGARPALSRVVEAATMRGDLPTAIELTARLVAQASELAAPLVQSLVSAAQGQVALLRDEDAVPALARAVDGLDRLGYRFEAGRVRLALTRALLRDGRRAAARTAATRAAGYFTEVEAHAWAVTAEELRVRADAGAPRSGVLTVAERQIAELVAAGRMNREIAAALFVSTSTVEAHLTRIYRKLQLRHRTELAAWVRQASGR